MNLRERMDDIRNRSVDNDELPRQIEWQVNYYQEILAEQGNALPMGRADCEALAWTDAAPSEMEIMREALHAEFLERIQAEADALLPA